VHTVPPSLHLEEATPRIIEAAGTLHFCRITDPIPVAGTIAAAVELWISRSEACPHARPILRMGQRSDQYRRCRSLIRSVESTGCASPLSGGNRIDARTLLLARFGLRAAAGRRCFQKPDLRRSCGVVGKMHKAATDQPDLCSGTL